MTKNINEIIDSMSKMNILEIVELTKAMEKKFNISVNDLPSNQNHAKPLVDQEEKPKEQTEYSIVMTSYGNNKLNVIKTIRAILNLGLKEAKDFVEKLPAVIKEKIQKDEAENIKNKLEDCGAKIELR